MSKRIALVFALALVASVVFAQGSVTTETRVEFCKVRNADGTYSYTKGAPVRVTIRPMEATLMSEAGKSKRWSPFKRFGGGPVPASGDVTVYQNSTGANFVADSSPSCLDDLTLTTAANGKAWKTVNFALHLDTDSRTGKFLVRWRGYETFTSGLGPGVSAFSDEMFDFGFYLERSKFPAGQPDFTLEVDLTQNPLAIVPNQTCFLAQQFREPQLPVEQGEGEFTSTWNIFSSDGPQVGQSEDLFYYDSPADGVYDETELDTFAPENPGVANFHFKVQVASSPTQSLNPFAYLWQTGTPVAGNLGSLWFDDQAYLVGRAAGDVDRNTPPAMLVTETFAPSPNITSLRIDVDAKANTPGLSMRIELFNFTTGQYVTVYQAATGTSDIRGIGFAATPPEFVQSGTGLLRTRTSFFRTGITLTYPWAVSVDQVQWIVTT
jgi:hypothetical protein